MASIGQELLNVPFSDMVYQLANAIAEAQANLDRSSIEILKVMGDEEKAPVSLPSLAINANGALEDTEITTSMIGAGFQPTFYQFAETIIEVKMAITVNRESTYENKYSGKQTRVRWSKNSFSVTSTPIDAKYSSKYSFTQEGSSLLRTRLVPVPPNSIIERQIELKSQYIQAKFEAEIAKAEEKLNED